MRYYIWKTDNGQYRWYLSAANNRKVAESGESYHNERDALAGIELVKGTANTPVHRLNYAA